MKKIIAMLLAFAMVFALAACGSSGTNSAPADNGSNVTAPAASDASDPYADLDPVTINCVTIFESETGIVHALKYMGEQLSERTNGKLTMEIYDAGQTGGENEQAEALVIGEVDMAAFGTLPISTYATEYSFFDSPFVFADGEHFMNAWDGALGDGMREKLSAAGLYTLGAMGRGYRHITSSVPINSIEDMKGLVIRTPQSALFTDTFGALGCVCVPIALTELFTSLQTGVAQASEGPWDQIVSNKLYEVQKYIVESTYYYSISMWCMNQSFYENLPEAYRTLIDEVAAEALDYGTEQSNQMAEEQKQVCVDAGCTILELGDLTPYLEAVSDVMNRFYAEKWTVTSAEEVASYRT